MIEATCAACGTVNRIAEADVSPGTKSVTCESCKARIQLPGAKPAIPAVPKSIPAIPPKQPKRAETGPLADLPTPKRSGPLAGIEASKPAPKSGLDIADLPTPKGKPSGPLDLDNGVDLPTPKGKGPLDDLLTPKAKSPLDDLPTPKAKSALDNLPTPKGPAKPAAPPKPKTPALGTPARPGADADLLAPKPRKPAPTPPVAAQRPPAPAPALELDALDDLPAPTVGIADLPAPLPGNNLDLPAPKGFFDDLPQPAKRSSAGSSDLPAPKGFFDDLPQPAKPAAAAKPASADLPAPKGFFDDLPQPALTNAPAPPAPKGFFDDLPQPASASSPSPPAPKGFFDDLPQPAKPAAPAASNVFDDLPEPSADGSMELGAGELDLGPANAAPPLDLDGGPELDLGLAGDKPPPPKSDFADLDLSAPTLPPMPAAAAKAGINFKPASPTPGTARAASPAASIAAATQPKAGELKLDLEDETKRGETALTTPAAHQAAKKRAAVAEASADAKARKQRRTRTVLGALLGVAVLGGGGAFFYRRHRAAEERAEQIQEHLAAARKAIHSGAPAHWSTAANESTEVLSLDAHNVEGMGLRAEALLGGTIDTGIGGDAKIGAGRKVVADALEAGITGPQLDAAQALGMIAAHQADRAVTKLQAMVQREPKNAFWQLYLGWALSAKGDPAGAVKAFDAAIAADPTVKLPALYARGRAKIQMLDLDGAKADFAAVLELKKDHIGAQVGLAAALPAAQASQRETDLLAILARKDIGGGDPRAVVQAWTLAADTARDGGRLDVARDRYQKALALAKTDVNALVGLARVELADNKPDVAADLVAKALAQAPDSALAQLVAGELDVKQGKLDEAFAIEQKLAARKPPLPPLQGASLQLLLGNIDDARGSDEDAITAWTDGAKLAGDLDLSPRMAAVTKLGALAKKATDNHDDAKATAYRQRADQLLSALADRAQEDAALARTLGGAYLNGGDPVKAETFLRRAVEMQGTDIDAHLELAKALDKQGRTDDALAELKAAQALDASRSDIALELARTYDDAGRTDEAAAAYAKLLQAKDVTVQARVRAGRFLARTGHIADAAAQAAPILAAEPDNPAGHYLKGEGDLADGKLDDARRELSVAVEADADPQYLDAQGRAAEASGARDPKYYDLALRAYDRALQVAPNMENPNAGTGRIYLARQEWSKAIGPLQAAAKLAPNDGDVMFNVGIASKNLGQPQIAIKWLNAVPKKNARTWWELGQLYQDANSGSTAGALEQATRLGAEEEKAGTKVDWLTEAYYRLGEVEYIAHNAVAARAAYQHYVERGPQQGAQLNEARRLLNGELRGP
jgi:predicted Zn-dependent protease